MPNRHWRGEHNRYRDPLRPACRLRRSRKRSRPHHQLHFRGHDSGHRRMPHRSRPPQAAPRRLRHRLPAPRDRASQGGETKRVPDRGGHRHAGAPRRRVLPHLVRPRPGHRGHVRRSRRSSGTGTGKLMHGKGRAKETRNWFFCTSSKYVKEMASIFTCPERGAKKAAFPLRERADRPPMLASSSLLPVLQLTADRPEIGRFQGYREAISSRIGFRSTGWRATSYIWSAQTGEPFVQISSRMFKVRCKRGGHTRPPLLPLVGWVGCPHPAFGSW